VNPIEWVVSSVKVIRQIYRWVGQLVKNRLRDRSDELARRAPTASVLRGSRIKLRWYQWPAARELQREGHGAIRDGYYERWINITPPAILQAMARRGSAR
jgi:hypothetical protein